METYPNMQGNSSDPLDLNKGQMCSTQYELTPPPYDGCWISYIKKQKNKEKTAKTKRS